MLHFYFPGVLCPDTASLSEQKYISVIVGQVELKWNLLDVFLCPGLRKETLLFADDVDPDDPYPPWTFHTSDHHNPMIYGYRTLWLEWDFRKTGYKVCQSIVHDLPARYLLVYCIGNVTILKLLLLLTVHAL